MCGSKEQIIEEKRGRGRGEEQGLKKVSGRWKEAEQKRVDKKVVANELRVVVSAEQELTDGTRAAVPTHPAVCNSTKREKD